MTKTTSVILKFKPETLNKLEEFLEFNFTPITSNIVLDDVLTFLTKVMTHLEDLEEMEKLDAKHNSIEDLADYILELESEEDGDDEEDSDMSEEESEDEEEILEVRHKLLIDNIIEVHDLLLEGIVSYPENITLISPLADVINDSVFSSYSISKEGNNIVFNYIQKD